MFLGYLIVCIGVWANLQNITEMTIAFPTSGNYVDFADRWVDPALAFGAGLAEWLGESLHHPGIVDTGEDIELTSGRHRMDICICRRGDLFCYLGQFLGWGCCSRCSFAYVIFIYTLDSFH
jgi:hypothetical protein